MSMKSSTVTQTSTPTNSAYDTQVRCQHVPPIFKKPSQTAHNDNNPTTQPPTPSPTRAQKPIPHQPLAPHHIKNIKPQRHRIPQPHKYLQTLQYQLPLLPHNLSRKKPERRPSLIILVTFAVRFQRAVQFVKRKVGASFSDGAVYSCFGDGDVVVGESDSQGAGGDVEDVVVGGEVATVFESQLLRCFREGVY